MKKSTVEYTPGFDLSELKYILGQIYGEDIATNLSETEVCIAASRLCIAVVNQMLKDQDQSIFFSISKNDKSKSHAT